MEEAHLETASIARHGSVTTPVAARARSRVAGVAETSGRHQGGHAGLRAALLALLLAAVTWAVVSSDVEPPETLYVDPAQGFSLRLPGDMQVDRSLGPVVTTISNRSTSVEVFHQWLGDDATADNYVYYKSRPIRFGVDPVTVTVDRRFATVRWPRIHELAWRRPPLARVEHDRNHYAAWDFVVGPKEIWSIHVETADPTWIERHGPTIVSSFETFAPTAPSRFVRRRSARRAGAMSPIAKEAFERLFQSDRQTWGIYEHGAEVSYAGLREIERELDHRFEVLLHYILINETNVPSMLASAREDGRIVELTLQLAPPDHDPSSAFVYDVLNGRYDTELRRIARQVAEAKTPVLFRLNNEMNGDWVVYSGYWTSQDAEIFKHTWRYVFRIFQQEGATNAIWVWNPHDRSFPPFQYNHMLMYDPGPEYYDVVGMTGYNNGTYYPNEIWRTFDEIYGPLYAEYLQLFPDKPFMITEFGSSTFGGDKVSWIEDMMERLPAYPNIKVAVWWNGIDMDGDKPARPYRLQGDAVMATFRVGLARFR